MPVIVADSVDAYVVRRLGARVQFLLLQRRDDLPFGGVWQSIHARIDAKETAVQAATAAVVNATGLTPVATYSADYVNQFYDHERDLIVLAPAFAFMLAPGGTPVLAAEYQATGWFDLEETVDRLLWHGQRAGARRIHEVLARSGEDSALYRIG